MGKKIISRSKKLTKSGMKKQKRNQLSASIRRRIYFNLENTLLDIPNSQLSKENIISKLILSLVAFTIELNAKKKVYSFKI